MTTTASASELGWHRCDDDPDRRWVHLASVERAGVAPGSILDFDHPPAHDEEPLLAWTHCFVCAYAERLEEVERAVAEHAEFVSSVAGSTVIAFPATARARARADEAWRVRPAEPSTAERPTSLTLPCGSERGSDLLLVLGTAAEVTTAARGAAEDAVDALAAVLRLARSAAATTTTSSPPPGPTAVEDPHLARLAAVAALVRRDSGSTSTEAGSSSPESEPSRAVRAVEGICLVDLDSADLVDGGRRGPRVYTSRVGCRDPDALDVTRKSAGPAGLPFAPSWALLRRALPKLAKGAPVVTPEQYEVEYRAEMAASRARDPGAWEAMLARPRVVLLCYCASKSDRCHRRLLARMLVELGGSDHGELSAAGREVAEPAVEPAEPPDPDDEPPPPPTGQVTLF